MYIWEFKQATKGNGQNAEWDLGHYDVKKEYFSSLLKCRKEAKKRVEEQGLSREHWTEERWTIKEKYCIVRNCGGCGLFSFSRIEVK